MENVIGGAGIEKQWHDQLKLSGRDSDAALFGLRGAQIFDRVEIDDDPDALTVLQNTASILADAIATITCLINPSLIVLGGGVGSHTTLRNEVERLLGQSNFPHPAVRTSVLGTEAQLFGAVSLSLSLIESRLVC
jgi:glucokinase